MHTTVFSATPELESAITAANTSPELEFRYTEAALSADNAGFLSDTQAVCLGDADAADEATLDALSAAGVKLIVLRSTDFSRANPEYAHKVGIYVCHMPSADANVAAYIVETVAGGAAGKFVNVVTYKDVHGKAFINPTLRPWATK